MALSRQNLLRGNDFTGINPATGVDHNNLVDLVDPVADNANEGKGFNLWTKDSALNTPRVPDPTVDAMFDQWKRFIWIRIPHSTATSKVPLFYAWNDNATSVATFLKWNRIEADLTVIQAEVDALETDLSSVEGVANNAATVASAAASSAATALTNASEALATANTANTNATQALDDAADAQARADAAYDLAGTANTNANTAITTANNANTNSQAVAANKFFTSQEYNIIAGPVFTEDHGFATKPKFMRGVLVCKVSEHGYSDANGGDEVDMAYMDNNSSGQQAFQLGCDKDVVFVIAWTNVANIDILNKTTGAIVPGLTAANWRIKVYAWL